MTLGMFIKIPFGEGNDLGAVPIVKADPDPGRGRPSGDLHEPDPWRVKDLLHIVTYLVYFALNCHPLILRSSSLKKYYFNIQDRLVMLIYRIYISMGLIFCNSNI